MFHDPPDNRVLQERMNALVSGRHCRLGALSPVLPLTDLALKLIADEVLSGERRIHGSVEDTKLSTNKQHSLWI